MGWNGSSAAQAESGRDRRDPRRQRSRNSTRGWSRSSRARRTWCSTASGSTTRTGSSRWPASGRRRPPIGHVYVKPDEARPGVARNPARTRSRPANAIGRSRWRPFAPAGAPRSPTDSPAFTSRSAFHRPGTGRELWMRIRYVADPEIPARLRSRNLWTIPNWPRASPAKPCSWATRRALPAIAR